MSYEFYNTLIISILQRVKAAFIYIGLLIYSDAIGFVHLFK